MKCLNRLLATTVAGLTALVVVVPSALAGVVPLENRLPAWEDYGTKTVDFTNVDISYTNGRTKKGNTTDTVFFGESSNSTVLSLNSATDGYDNVVFDGDFIIDAQISSKGVLRDGSTFGFYSNDAMFGTGNTTDYGCNKQGKNCSTGQLVFGGDLTAFGWSGSQGILEFVTDNLLGWAMDEWQPGEPFGFRSEHLYLDVGEFTLNDVSSVKSFNATADGFAVVPVPAAAWLFGTGLLGLIGFARSKRS